MKSLILSAVVASLAVAPAALAGETSQSVREATDTPAVQIEKGDMLYSSAGRRLGKVYRVTPEGNAQIIIQSRSVTVPASAIAETDGKLVTTYASSKDLLKGS